MKKAGVKPNGKTQEISNYPSRGKMCASKILDLLQQGREGEKAAAKVCRDLHERRLMRNMIILQIMIDHCVNSDFEWPVAADEGALMSVLPATLQFNTRAVVATPPRRHRSAADMEPRQLSWS